MSDRVDGNSTTDGQPMYNTSTHGDIMEPLAPGAFGVTVTTSDVKAGMNNIETVTLTPSDGSMGIFAEHHQLGILSDQMPGQDFAGVRDAGSM